MICDAPTQPLAPPSWTMQVSGSSEPSLVLGFTTFGTEAQLTRLAGVVQSSGLVCEVPAGAAGAQRMLVLFGASTTRDQAFAIFNRVSGGEFGTSDHRLIVVPAKEAQAR